MAPDNIAAELRAGLRRLMVLVCCLGLAVVGLFVVAAWQFDQTHSEAARGQQAHAALCVFKADLKRRVVTGFAFLKEHPAGIPGIPAATLRASITNEQRTFDTLHELKCR